MEGAHLLVLPGWSRTDLTGALVLEYSRVGANASNGALRWAVTGTLVEEIFGGGTAGKSPGLRVAGTAYCGRWAGNFAVREPNEEALMPDSKALSQPPTLAVRVASSNSNPNAQENSHGWHEAFNNLWQAASTKPPECCPTTSGKTAD